MKAIFKWWKDSTGLESNDLSHGKLHSLFFLAATQNPLIIKNCSFVVNRLGVVEEGFIEFFKQ